jgi:aromatic-L-amino-acid/L-tryptophan decarboxylase
MGSFDKKNATGGMQVMDGAIDAFRPLDPDDVCSYLHKVVDFVVDYFQFVESLPVLPDVRPGYLRQLLNPAPFDVAMKELRATVVPCHERTGPAPTSSRSSLPRTAWPPSPGSSSPPR